VTVLTGAQADSADWRQFWRWQLWHVWTCLQPQLPLHVAQRSHQRHGRRPGSWCASYCESFGLCYTAVYSSDGALSYSPACIVELTTCSELAAFCCTEAHMMCGIPSAHLIVQKACCPLLCFYKALHACGN